MSRLSNWEEYVPPLCTLVPGFALICSCSRKSSPATTTADVLVPLLKTNILDTKNGLFAVYIICPVFGSFVCINAALTNPANSFLKILVPKLDSKRLPL